MTKILKLNEMTAPDFQAVARSLESGGLACLPSDTVYGLACLPDNAAAIERLYVLKGREQRKPLALVFTSIGQIHETFPGLPDRISAAIDQLLPGPVTAIIPVDCPLNFNIHSEGSAGVRIIPPPAGDLYLNLPGPLAVTSANISGSPDPVAVEEIPPEIAAACEFIIDGGRCELCQPSTVVDLRPMVQGRPAHILREGSMPRSDIEAVAGRLD